MRPNEYRQLFVLEETHWWYVGLRELLFAFLDRAFANRPIRLLDAGCGAGLVLKLLARPGTSFGLDLSPTALSFCRRRNLRNLLRASADRLPVCNAQFDCILSLDVLYHRWIQNDAAALIEYARALKPGGRLILHLPAYPFLKSSHDRAIGTARRYTAGEVHRKLVRAGFRVERLTYRNTLLFPPLLVMRLIRKAHPLETSDLRRLPPALNALCLNLLRLENRLLIRNIRLPFGSSIFCLAVRPEHSPDPGGQRTV